MQIVDWFREVQCRQRNVVNASKGTSLRITISFICTPHIQCDFTLHFAGLDVSGALSLVNENNGVGLLKCDSVGMSYSWREILFIEFEGQKYLASISWSY